MARATGGETQFAPDSQTLFEAACNNATVAIFVMDHRQHCIYMNPAAEQLTGFGLAEVQGKPLHEVIHHTRPDGTAYPMSECPIDRAFPQKHKQQGEEVFVHRDGHFYPVAYTASPILHRGAIVGTIIEVRDIRQEKESRHALESETRALETINQTARTIAAERDIDRILQTVTDAALELSGAEFGAFFYNVVNDEGEEYQLYTLSGAPREAFEGFPMPRNTKVFGPTFRGEAILRSDDITADVRYGQNPPYQGMPAGHLPVRSYMAVPVISRSGEVFGGLFFGHERVGVFTERAERMVAGIAAHAAVAIDNARLFAQAQAEIAERRRAEQQKQLLIDELNHRVKNMLATVQAIAGQSLREAPPAAREAFGNRLRSLSNAYTLLVRRDWEGAGLREVAAEVLTPFGYSPASERCRIVGDDVRLPPNSSLVISMALHELATNAAKYGALSQDGGIVELTWEVQPGSEGDLLSIRWRESGGPAVEPPKKKGFGSMLLERGLAFEVGGRVDVSYERTGVICVIEMPTPSAALQSN